MLVLSRIQDEDIVITNTQTGEQILVKLVSVKGNRVRIGVEASERYRIHRGEIQQKVDGQQEQGGGAP